MLKSEPSRTPYTPTALQLYGAVAVGVLSVSSASVLIRLTPAPANAIAFWRLILTALLLMPVVLRQSPTWLSLRHLKLFTISGLFLALHFIFWIQSLMILPVALSTALVSTHPLLIALYTRIVRKQPFPMRIKIGLASATLGLVILPIGAAWSFHQTAGMVDALLGALFAGLYLMAGKHSRQSLSASQYSFGTYLMSSFLLFLINMFQKHSLGPVNGHVMILYLLMAIIPTLGGHTTFNWLLRFMPAGQVSMAMIGEIPGSAMLAWVILRQMPSWTVWISLIFLTLGIVMTLRSTKEPTPADSGL
ncbi:MAG: hypothetical protein C7B47_04780 [Sulfobacillus thermosulfidooxidans]|uniref:EamA domain-containing protein n=1 Tax=Sulfobacillus thermosulfidooxidans TaxID=28034 RepID=A0A2T2X1Y8_SULTH|nr:MAG: hypothetical protein C7B47_04780 [Sulfobacillus thermosulfidooxidans]